ncbi:hypothetical protein ACJIZ3_020096 [Penstemon smallii]|uniref:Uncharacterized protein n=1 Tax=Penstemon smallii TaxID=265156 RepID=A0ABD3SHX6_9LAMI
MSTLWSQSWCVLKEDTNTMICLLCLLVSIAVKT